MAALRLGMPTLIEFDDLAANVELCRRLGLSFIELNMNSPLFGPAALPAGELRQISRQSGLEFTLHLPEELDLASFQSPIREGHIAVALDAVSYAAEAAIPLVNMHFGSGVYFTLPDRRVWIYDKYRSEFLARLEGSWARLMETAADNGVTVCIENCGDLSRPFVREGVERLLDLHPSLRLTWDVGHDAAAGFPDTTFMMEHVPRVAHMHLHDADGRDSHRPLLSGKVDVPAAIEFARKNDLRVVIEVKTAAALEESLRSLDERGLR
jgi:sugar phosphate isomerase/epimerase